MIWISQRLYSHTILFLSGFAISGQTIASQIQQENMEMALDVAEEVASDIVTKLHGEKSQVIFLDIPSCSMSIDWCHAFLGRLNTELSENRIRFLPETEAKEIRSKIAQEQIYQQTSQMIDIKKAVELGRQDAFQAFVTVSIIGDVDTGYLTVQGQSIQVESASVTISIFKTIKIQKDNTRSWGRIITGSFIMGLGIAGTYRSIELTRYHKENGDHAYNLYRHADNAEDATNWRKKSERHDARAKSSKIGEISGWVLTSLGALYLLSGSEESLTYDIAQYQHGTGSGNYIANIDISPVAGPNALGFKLVWDF